MELDSHQQFRGIASNRAAASGSGVAWLESFKESTKGIMRSVAADDFKTGAMILKQASEGALLGGRPPCENKLLGSGAVASAAAKTNLFKTRRGPGSAL